MTDLTRFAACWPYTLAQECPYPNDWSNPRNFSDTPGDPGGATMDGIIQSEFNDFLIHDGLPLTSVRNITQPQGQTIYVDNYWMPYCPLLPVGLDMDFFDAAVNEGKGEAIRILQVALGVNNDGIWGPQTNGAVQALNSPVATTNAIKLFTARRIVVYRETSGFDEFGTDWIRRATQIGNESLSMTQPTTMTTLSRMGLVGSPHVPKAKWFLPPR